MKNVMLSPSLLSADFANLGGELLKIEQNGGSLVHIDVMDGHFVPPVSYGQPVITSIRKCTKLPFDVHLMVEKPEQSIPSFIDAGADYVTFHMEATNHADLCLDLIHKAGKKGRNCNLPSHSHWRNGAFAAFCRPRACYDGKSRFWGTKTYSLYGSKSSRSCRYTKGEGV